MANEKLNLKAVKNSKEFKIDYSNIKQLQEIEFDDTIKVKRQTFGNYKRRREKLDKPLIKRVPRPSFGPGLKIFTKYSTHVYTKGRMIVVVNYDLYPDIKSSIDQYVLDVANDGYYADVYRYKGGTAADLRKFIIRNRKRLIEDPRESKGEKKNEKDRKRKAALRGVVFVGNLPIAWYEHKARGHSSVFPCDLFFMDANGRWKDKDKDGDYNIHAGDIDAEIWVGRIWTPDMNGNNARLINQYFARNHYFRKGRLGQSNKGLTIVDDDWAGFGDCAMDMMLPSSNIDVCTDKKETNANTYKAKMAKHFGWAQVCAHSNPYLHRFSIPNEPFKEEDNYIRVKYIKDENPPQANFYNLFACSSALFTQPDYMAGWYIFDKPGNGINPGMAAIGSTKSGSMLFFENFYGPMGKGMTIGEAFVEWWKCLGAKHEDWEIGWFYGLVLLGDPTLNWWSGVVPKQISPFPYQIFSHYPRDTRFEWTPVAVEGVPVEYHVETDHFCCGWASDQAIESGKSHNYTYKTSKTYLDHLFVGAQRGRWRVRAKVGDILCPWSEWRYFCYTI